MEQIMLEEKKITHEIEEAAIHNLGDGIGCLAFRSKGNSISPAIREFILKVATEDLLGYDGLVIGNQAKNFSVGANLFSIKEDIDKKNFPAFDHRVRSFQTMTMALKQSKKPIVAAPYKNTLGGGLEVVLHAHARVALRKSYMGLVEVGVGLIPGGGGTKESALLATHAAGAGEQTRILKKTFERLVIRTVSANAEEAKEFGYLQPADQIVETPEELIGSAKAVCLARLADGLTGKGEERVLLPGKAGYDLLMEHAEGLLAAGTITPYDLAIGKRIALVLCGSATEEAREYGEWEILDLERRMFVELTRDPGTYERIRHFIEKNELLRN